jgi:phosphoribosyl 1,2-cyclic phosphodiesterase
MEITFWGVRGSYPVPGPNTVRYGGQTSCVEVKDAAGRSLIVDAGTGLRELGRKLARDTTRTSRDFHILLSHVHWDHIQGLPFFEPAYLEGTAIAIYTLRTATDEIHHVVSGITRHEFFPMPLESVPADFAFHEVVPKKALKINEFDVLPIALNHPFGAVGYRIEGDGTSVAYISDTAPFTRVLHKQHFLEGPEELTDADRATLAQLEADLLAAIDGCDTIIYDTHFLPAEYEKFPHYGHSTPDYALDICVAAKVRCLVLYHHAPSHSDILMDQIADQYHDRGAEVGVEVVTSYERMTLRIGTPAGDAYKRGGASEVGP